jgi:hypothetical protein
MAFNLINQVFHNILYYHLKILQKKKKKKKEKEKERFLFMDDESLPLRLKTETHHVQSWIHDKKIFVIIYMELL